MNHSMNFSSTYPTLEVLKVTSVVALLIIPPISIYVLLLIARGSMETITSEFYCLNILVADILMCFFCVFYLIGEHCSVFLLIGNFFIGFVTIPRHLFQSCICVERYLAVVHPLIFLKYKLLRYKIMASSVLWLMVLAICVSFVLPYQTKTVLYKVLLGLYIFLFSLMLFCGVSILWVLKQPGPGEGKRQKAAGYDAKRRAFTIIMIITVVSVINYLPYVLLLFLYGTIHQDVFVFLTVIFLCFSILCGLINPLFYLKRAEKLPSLRFDLQRFILIR